MKRILLEPAYVLHRRPYRETSVLLELLTLNHGRISLVANGVRKEKSTTQGVLQPFVPLLLSCSGNGELLRLNSIEMNGPVLKLHGECLYAGLYLNELLMYLLEKWDAHPALFDIYANTIAELQADSLQQQVLRRFEKNLLQEIGYGLLPFTHSSASTLYLADKFYRFIPDQGFVSCDEEAGACGNIFSGKSLLAIIADDWLVDGVLQEAKRLMRLVITPLLGGRSIHSRKLFT